MTNLRHGVYTIPSGTGFLKRLAEGVLAISYEDPQHDEFTLSRMRILLPTRRACRELQDCFINLSKNKPILLPRLQPIGDVDAEEIELYLTGFGVTHFDIPPAISSLERKFLLSSLIKIKDKELGLDTALSLATELSKLIDTVYTEDLDFTRFAKIVPDTLSIHWQKSLEFLEIITEFWPKILAERGQIDPSDRRNRLLKSLGLLWRDYPPTTPIIAAGSTGSIPAAGELLKTISNLPQGLVILPGLDLDLDDESWNAITDTHPQATMRNLLKRFELPRNSVKMWPESHATLSPRSHLIRSIMRPTDTFGAKFDDRIKDSLKNLDIIEAATAREEASIIALTLREAMEIPNKTACLITSDRTLTRRVMSALHRWGIEVDDSAGGALATTKAASFLTSLLRVIEDNFAPLPLLDFLKHDYQRLIPENDVMIFERHILRGPRPADGISGLKRRLSLLSLSTQYHGTLDRTLGLLDKNFDSLIKLRSGDYSLGNFCQALLECAEIFSEHKDFLWAQPESDALSNFMAGVIGYSELIPLINLHIFSGVFSELISSENYRSHDEPHRRILILGQMESRLINRDLMVLGGMNEGTWPRDMGHDPWMSKPMRKNFGLPPAERSVGLAAHDFAEHLSSAHVIITRSLKAEGTATVPARWLQKLRTLLKASQIDSDWANHGRYLEWVRQLDRPDLRIPLSAPIPEPCPPLSSRPQELSATWIEKWMKNPYRLYAEKILKLKRLDPLDKNTIHAERGSFVHDVFLNFISSYPQTIPENPKAVILKMAKDKLSEFESIPTHWHYWWPRFERMVEWFIETEQDWRKNATPWIQEETGLLEIYQNPDTNRRFTVTAKADRIDKLKTGKDEVAILDYKTGTPPAKYKIKSGMAPQLPIEILILSKGGYKNIALSPTAMIYWKLSGSHSNKGELKEIKLDMAEVITGTEEGLRHLVERYENPLIPYVARITAGKLYDDERAYAHLSRMAEWSSGEQEDDDESEGLE